MDNHACIDPGGFAGKGEWTTFYTYEGGPARSQALFDMAGMLVGDGPVLMIDWDLESPGLHYLSGRQREHAGVLEYFEASQQHLACLERTMAGSDPDALARRVLETVDWRHYVERVDAARPLFLMRAGRMDATYGERAARLDWTALFHACPALLRRFRTCLSAAFRHVLVDARSGRSPAVSVCTSLLPDRLVGQFTPVQPSLDGLVGVVGRALAYRRTHEDDQRPLVFYPLPCADSRTAPDASWRASYQGVLEAFMASSYGHARLSLDMWFNHVARDSAAALVALHDWLASHCLPWHVPARLALHDGRPLPVSGHDARRMRQLVDAIETQLDHLQQLVDRHALHEARPVADGLRDLVLRPAVAHGVRRRGAALIKQVYRHDNDTDALLSFTQDELASLEQVLHEAVAGRPWPIAASVV